MPDPWAPPSGQPPEREAPSSKPQAPRKISFHTFRDWWEDAKELSSSWREEARENYDFVVGRQYSEADIAKLRESGRPDVVFNRIAYILEAVAGAEVANRQEVRYIPREPGDMRVNELFTSAAEWVRDLCQAEDEESDAFRDMLITGLGATETRIDYETDPDGKIVINRLDPLSLFFDPTSTQRNYRDARYVFRVKQDVPLSEARAMFPRAADEELHASWAQDESTNDRVIRNRVAYEKLDRAIQQSGQARDMRDELVTLVEVQFYEREAVWEVVSMMGQAELDDDQLPVFEDRMRELAETQGVPPEMLYQKVQRTRRVYYRAWLGDSIVLHQHRLDPQEGGFRIKAMTGLRDRNNGCYYGLVRSGKDPQRWANKWLSQTMHIMNTNAKGGLIAEEDAFVSPSRAAEDWARNDTIIYTRAGALQNGKIKEREVAAYPTGFANLMEFAIVSIRDCMGVNPELLGQVDRAQAGILEYQRRQSGMMILAPLFDAMRLYRKEQGTLMLFMIRRYLADGRLVRIVAEDQQQYVPLIEQEGVAEFDVIVDETPTAPSQRDRIWQVMQQMLPLLQNVASPEVWAEVVKHSPLPASMAEKISEQLMQMREGPEAQMQQHAAQLQFQQQMTDMAKTASETKLNNAKAMLEQVKAQIEQGKPAREALADAAKTVDMMSKLRPQVPGANGAANGSV